MLIMVCELKAAPENEELTLKVEGIEETKGSLMIAVFTNANGFPSDDEKALLRKTVRVDQNKMDVKLNIPHGRYAIAIYQDKNSNGKLDTNFIGIPREPYGFSNNQRGRFGAPSFDDASFLFNRQNTVHNIQIK